ncbi:hypothetical protein LOTGIDRAFT_230602 [Lottia gigantea]|uniref:Uncharacterized protein n=1 Tax=Lottia gigantea TaxID=225164 RepID=V4B1M2_LOTGI|nr:hypothetical protein LOTGIDRAFT_230602 [Lottia gigantea]ESP01216.1 hypothetical protein LOTGIDRAFT_230602 [Lottia gigantea]
MEVQLVKQVMLNLLKNMHKFGVKWVGISKTQIFKVSTEGDEPDGISSSGTEDDADVPTKFSGTCISTGNQHAADSTSNSTSDLQKANEIPDETEDKTQLENLADKDKEGNDSQEFSNCSQEIGATGGKLSPVSEDKSADEEEKVIEDSNTNIDPKNPNSPEEGECSPGPKPEGDGAELIPMLTQNHMELLELEMRARAIKAMLKAQESHTSEQT